VAEWSFIETFDTDTYKDVANTTGDWSTGDGYLFTNTGQQAQSLHILNTYKQIVSVVLTSNEYDTLTNELTYYLSADNGETWEDVGLAGKPVDSFVLYKFTIPGKDLKWKVVNNSGGNSVLYTLTLSDVVFTSVSGEKELKTEWPNVVGLTAGTTKQTGEQMNLIPEEESLVSEKDTIGL